MLCCQTHRKLPFSSINNTPNRVTALPPTHSYKNVKVTEQFFHIIRHIDLIYRFVLIIASHHHLLCEYTKKCATFFPSSRFDISYKEIRVFLFLFIPCAVKYFHPFISSNSQYTGMNIKKVYTHRMCLKRDFPHFLKRIYMNYEEKLNIFVLFKRINWV